ncbi:MAG: hypothetical protein JWO19_1341 [Bryobacterales bacterium]|nr:hypothetical protein [Bryobacterales bacterium]
MFFRNEKPHEWTFEERLANLKQFGFEVQRQGAGALVTRDGCGAMVEDLGGGKVKVGKAGVLVGGEIASLVHGGYQMFLRTPSGKEIPALADQLKTLHAFDEDLREGLGLTSLYNLSLGTTADDHLYDRVEERDAPRHPRPWETKAAQS